MASRDNRYSTVEYIDNDGLLHTSGLYLTPAATWRETVKRAERVLKLRLGAENVCRVVVLNGNAA